MKFWQDLRRRKIYRPIGIYVVGAWLAIQVASTFFPAWSIPDTALRYLIIAAALGYPLALVFTDRRFRFCKQDSRKVQTTLQSWPEDGFGRSPKVLEKLALNQAMLGCTDEALATLESAASMGWRTYYFVLNDQRWQETMGLPEFKSLMSWLKADIDRQRERIEAIELKEDFRAYVGAWGTSG